MYGYGQHVMSENDVCLALDTLCDRRLRKKYLGVEQVEKMSTNVYRLADRNFVAVDTENGKVSRYDVYGGHISGPEIDRTLWIEACELQDFASQGGTI